MSSPNSLSSGPSANQEAIERLCASHLHRSFWLPENASHGNIRVTYSTTSNFTDTTLPVILFCNPMFGSRWANVAFERLANVSGVRVIDIDRPGMGGSTQVPSNLRLPTWLEAATALLKILDVEHVSLMCHSAGTMYCLTTLYHLRHLLDPQRPYVGIIAPWVHNEHSNMALWNMISKLPIGMFGLWNNVVGFIQQQVAPSVAWSGGLVTAVSGMFKTSTEGTDTPGKRYGTSEEVGKEIDRLQTKYLFSEDTTAGNEEAKLCLKKGDAVTWGICDDYEEYVRSVCAQEREIRSADPSLPKLKLRVYYAASDVMIGKGGQQYFDKCWRQDGVRDVVDFVSKELPDTDHDSALIDQDAGAMKDIFADIGKE